MLKRRILLGLLVVAVLLAGCSDDNKTDIKSLESSKASKVDMDVTAFFQKTESVNEYVSPFEEGMNKTTLMTTSAAKSTSPTERLVQKMNVDKASNSNDVKRQIVKYTVTKTSLETEDGEILLMNKTKWKSKGWSHYVVSTNETVKVKAGTFEECVLVVSVDKKTGLKKKTYYAKEVGMIKTTSQAKGEKERTLIELVETDSL
ncbi:hypothetical protein ACFQPF_05480 [Fictibacillus iocasae]|uniref:Lipoprotein n=1 Tax=Fictibacillus iocasae TaxID=2715437 RepID=A0ABW2NL31_9BACL